MALCLVCVLAFPDMRTCRWNIVETVWYGRLITSCAALHLLTRFSTIKAHMSKLLAPGCTTEYGSSISHFLATGQTGTEIDQVLVVV